MTNASRKLKFDIAPIAYRCFFVYEFERGYNSPAPFLSCIPRQVEGCSFAVKQIPECSFNMGHFNIFHELTHLAHFLYDPNSSKLSMGQCVCKEGSHYNILLLVSNYLKASKTYEEHLKSTFICLCCFNIDRSEGRKKQIVVLFNLGWNCVIK